MPEGSLASPGGTTRGPRSTPRACLPCTCRPAGCSRRRLLGNCQAARTHKAGHPHIRNLGMTVAQVQQDELLEFMFTFGSNNEYDWTVYSLRYDETAFDVGADADGRITERPVFNQHGGLASSTGEQRHCEECVFPPCSLEDKTAVTMYEAIKQRHHDAIPTLMRSAKLACLHINSDAVSSNLELVRLFFANMAPVTAMLLFCKCLQHQASLILSGVTIAAGFMGPLFCTARQLQKETMLKALEKSLFAILNRDLVILDREVHGPPTPEDLDRTAKLLGVVYKSRVARASVGTGRA